MTARARRLAIAALALAACVAAVAAAAPRRPAPRKPPPRRLGAPVLTARARTTARVVPSRTYGIGRRVWVYVPPAYVRGDTCDLLVVLDGELYLDEIALPQVLDSLIAEHAIAPCVAAFVDDSSGAARIAELGNSARLPRFLADELLPWLRARWSVTSRPRRVTIAGSSAGGVAAAFAALERPDAFGNVLSQSGAFWRGPEGANRPPYEWQTAQWAAPPKRDVCFVLEVGASETAAALGGAAPSILEANRRLRDALQKGGYAVRYTEVAGGRHSTATWGARLPAALVTMGRLGAGLR